MHNFSRTLHELFSSVYWNETPLMAGLLFWLHEINVTTWIFEAYIGKIICWLVYCSDYMSSHWLHGFFARIYRNQTPFSVHLVFDYMRSFWLHELFACVYWNETPLMAGLLFWLHEISLTTWVFEAYVGKSICWLVLSSDYMSSFRLHGFLARMYRIQTPSHDFGREFRISI